MITVSEAQELLNYTGDIRDLRVFQAHQVSLQAQSKDADLQEVSTKIKTAVKAICLTVTVEAENYGVDFTKLGVWTYVTVDGFSEHPSVKVTLNSNPTNPFYFKVSESFLIDDSFEDSLVEFLERSLAEYVYTGVSNTNLKVLNGVFEGIKEELQEEGLEVPFDIEFATGEVPILEITPSKVVFGNKYEAVELLSPNKTLSLLLSDNEGVQGTVEAIKQEIKDDWVSSPNPLVFLRKHNKHVLEFITGSLTTRRTNRPDIILRKSVTTELSKLDNRKTGLGYKLEEIEDSKYISVYKKEDGEITQVFPPVNVDTLVYLD